ncbi:hypothetical protein NFT52_001125 [Vibrio parahaemolyticus]|nr:hypothetical protein [Vibrio parahaemolyticus]
MVASKKNVYPFNTDTTGYQLDDADEIQAILEHARDSVLPFSGEYKASWLLNDFESPIWYTTKRGKGSIIDGKGVETDNITWNVTLPNGNNLCDDRYRILLDNIKKTSFLFRNGIITGKVIGNRRWHDVTGSLLVLAKFLVLYEDRYLPHKYGFNLLDQQGLNQFSINYSKGGITFALELPQRALLLFYQSAFNSECPLEVYSTIPNIDEELCKSIYLKLRETNLMRPLKSGEFKGALVFDLQRISSILNCDKESMSSERMRAFLRQFEIELKESELLVKYNIKSDYHGHRTPLLTDALNNPSNENSLVAITGHFEVLLFAHRHLPETSPNPCYLSINTARKAAMKYTKIDGRTPLLPIDIGLSYMNGAMKLVYKYGENLIDLYLEFLDKSHKPSKIKDINIEASIMRKNRLLFNRLSRLEKYRDLCIELNLSYPHTSTSKTKNKNTSEEYDLFSCLGDVMAASAILIAIMKPSRDDEIINLKRDCLYHELGGGYYLKLYLGKSNVGEAYEEVIKPIPYITAKSIELLQKLGNGIDIIMSTDTSDTLFYAPLSGLTNVGRVSKGVLNTKLDNFGDKLKIRLDEHKRRWYVRVHEMRKFFLILLFWHGRFNVLDAARDIAGHVDAEHIYRYVEANFPRTDLCAFEADFAIHCLSSQDRYDDFTHVDDSFEALRELVCKHFGVSSLEFIHQNEWEQYVRDLRNEDGFYLKPHSIQCETDDGQLVSFEISLIFGEAIYNAK